VILGVAASPASAQSAVHCGCASAPGLDARDQGCACTGNNDCCGVCAAGVCGPVNAVGLPDVPQCCDVDAQCAVFASTDSINFCAFPAGRNGRRTGCACASDADCCGDCVSGTCTAMTQPSMATAHGCCFYD
jgi:hypothetical protein